MAVSVAQSIIQRCWGMAVTRTAIRAFREVSILGGSTARISGYRVPYGSFAEARRAAAAKPVGYEFCTPDIYHHVTAMLLPGDYPALFWLQQKLRSAHRLFDYGGNIGLQYYSYSRYLSLPKAVRWTVCDIDPFVPRGRQLASERGADSLEFTYDPAEADGADMLLASGSLHYLEGSFAEQLRAFHKPPQDLIINRVPLIEGATVITLQDIGEALLPCAIRNRQDFISSVESAGYRLCDSWTIPELQCTLPLYPERSAYQYYGFYFHKD